MALYAALLQEDGTFLLQEDGSKLLLEPLEVILVAEFGSYTVTGQSATVVLSRIIEPDLFTNTNSFYTPTITVGAVNLSPSLYTNSQTFYTPIVSRGTITLTPSRLDNTQSFYAATVTVGAVDLTPDLFTNTNAFYSATVTTGSVDLTPDLYTNTNAFYSPTVTVGAVDLQPARYDNTQAFYSATVTAGAIDLQPPLVTNTNAFYTQTLDYLAYRYARPDSDISAGGWTPSSGGDLYAMIDEASASDADYILTAVASTCEVGLYPVIDPGTSVGHTINYRAQSTYGNTLTMTLKQGATTIATDTQATVAGSWTTYSYTLSGAEADAITDYGDLSITLEAA